MSIEATKEACLLFLNNIFALSLGDQTRYLELLLNHHCYEVRYATLKTLRGKR
jgi:hypothetical protein